LNLHKGLLFFLLGIEEMFTVLWFARGDKSTSPVIAEHTNTYTYIQNKQLPRRVIPTKAAYFS
jgi:hypothetical protein